MLKTIKIETKPLTDSVNDFAVKANRSPQYINRACDEDYIDHGFIFNDNGNKGFKLIILNAKAEAFIERCKKNDKK